MSDGTAPGQDPDGLSGLAGLVVDAIEAAGSPGVTGLLAVETVFPPIPSEVVLPVAGYLASTGRLSLPVTILAATLGSMLGALILYTVGGRLGPERLRRAAARIPLLHAGDIDRAQAWFDRHGTKAVLLGRLVPVVRSFISVPAGLARMPLPRFLTYTAAGSAVYNSALIGAGYALGARWTTIGRYSDPINYAVYTALLAALVAFAARRLRRAPGTGTGGDTGKLR